MILHLKGWWTIAKQRSATLAWCRSTLGITSIEVSVRVGGGATPYRNFGKCEEEKIGIYFSVENSSVYRKGGQPNTWGRVTRNSALFQLTWSLSQQEIDDDEEITLAPAHKQEDLFDQAYRSVFYRGAAEKRRRVDMSRPPPLKKRNMPRKIAIKKNTLF